MRQYRSNQGRSPEKQEEIYQVIKFAFIIFLAVIIGGLISGTLVI
jgi:hypothetical protein